jgi:hypothetical protein
MVASAGRRGAHGMTAPCPPRARAAGKAGLRVPPPSPASESRLRVPPPSPASESRLRVPRLAAGKAGISPPSQAQCGLWLHPPASRRRAHGTAPCPRPAARRVQGGLRQCRGGLWPHPPAGRRRRVQGGGSTASLISIKDASSPVAMHRESARLRPPAGGGLKALRPPSLPL